MSTVFFESLNNSNFSFKEEIMLKLLNKISARLSVLRKVLLQLLLVCLLLYNIYDFIKNPEKPLLITRNIHSFLKLTTSTN